MTYAQTVAAFRARATQRIADISAYLDGGGPGGDERALDLALTLSDFLVTLGDDVLPQDEHLRLIHLLNDQLSFTGETPPAGTGLSVRFTAPAPLATFAPGDNVPLVLAVTGDGASLEILTGAGVSLGFATQAGVPTRYGALIAPPQAVGPVLLVARLTDRAGAVATAQLYLTAQATLAVPGQPTDCFARAVAGGLQVSATPPANNGGSAITGYVIYRDGNLSQPVATGVGLPFFDLQPSAVAHTYQVAATNAVGTGQPSLPSVALGTEPEGVEFVDAQGDDAVEFISAVAS